MTFPAKTALHQILQVLTKSSLCSIRCFNKPFVCVLFPGFFNWLAFLRFFLQAMKDKRYFGKKVKNHQQTHEPIKHRKVGHRQKLWTPDLNYSHFWKYGCKRRTNKNTPALDNKAWIKIDNGRVKAHSYKLNRCVYGNLCLRNLHRWPLRYCSPAFTQALRSESYINPWCRSFSSVQIFRDVIHYFDKQCELSQFLCKVILVWPIKAHC